MEHSYEMTWIPLCALFISNRCKSKSHESHWCTLPTYTVNVISGKSLYSLLCVCTLSVCVSVCGVLQQWGCWVLCVCVRTGAAGCVVRTCGRTPCCERPRSAGSLFSWSPRHRPLPCHPSLPRWTKSWVPREGSDGHFPPILTPETELLTACPRDTPS